MLKREICQLKDYQLLAHLAILERNLTAETHFSNTITKQFVKEYKWTLEAISKTFEIPIGTFKSHAMFKWLWE